MLYLQFLLLLLIPLIKSQDPCIEEPWNPACSSFEIKDNVIIPNNTDMCKNISRMYMSGCTIASICADASMKSLYPDYCKPFSLYKVMCLEMPGMNSCYGWRHMCVANSTVKQCQTKILPLMPGREYKNLVKAICNDMTMSGCEKCTTENGCGIDGLQVYSDLCNQMPDMSQCTNWNSLCSTFIKNWPLCPGGASIGPAMKMYFHFGYREYFLFQEWVPKSDAEFIIAVILIFLFSVGHEFLKYFRSNVEKSHRALFDGLLNKKVQTKSYPHVLASSFIYFVEVTLGFLLMLLAMTFNVTIFLAVVVGRFVGVLICGLLTDYTPAVTEESCH